MENSYQKFAKDVFIIGIANALAALSGIILLPLITKTLGAYDYGLWAQIQVTINLAPGEESRRHDANPPACSS